MFPHPPARALLFCFFLAVTAFSAKAQPLLPDMIGTTQDGMNILSWNCQYGIIKSIAVQRSSDSVYNFATIGYVKKLEKGPQAFIDGHPLPGANWYRLYIVFNSSLTWYSNYIKIEVDSMDLLKQKVLPPNDSLQKLASKVIITETGDDKTTGQTTISISADSSSSPGKAVTTKIIIPNINEHTAGAEIYIKSQYIFTNPFTGHVNVEISDFRNHPFSIRFFNQQNQEILHIPSIKEPSVIIDKRNFQRKGIYKFELMKEKALFETGYITIY